MYKLNLKDKKILYELDLNARQSNSEIGKKVGLSKEVVKYRIDNLIKEGIIIKFQTVINYFKLGITKHKLYLQLKDVNKEKLEEIGNYLKNHKKTEWVAICTGKWDLIVSFFVNNINELDEEILDLMNKYHNYIKDKAVTTTLHIIRHLREYLKENQKISSKSLVYHTTKDKKEKIDEKDLELLRLIVNNARMPVTELAYKLKLTPRIVEYKLRQLEKKEIILDYKCHLEPRLMGNIFCKVIFYVSNITKPKLNEFINYCSGIKESVWPQKVIGNWDFELDLEIENYEKFQEKILDIKSRFSDIISNHEFCIISKEFKLDLFPNAYPKV